jgi:hypothetical protein
LFGVLAKALKAKLKMHPEIDFVYTLRIVSKFNLGGLKINILNLALSIWSTKK